MSISGRANRRSYFTRPSGRYRHYKGKEYEVIGFAKHSETEEKLVLYIGLYDDNQMWVRPYDMFIETVEINGKQIPRFAKIN